MVRLALRGLKASLDRLVRPGPMVSQELLVRRAKRDLLEPMALLARQALLELKEKLVPSARRD